MGSAVPVHCQKHWSSNTAARGHVVSFIHEASSPACAGKEGESFRYPSLERHHLHETTCTFNFLMSAVICFCPHWNSSPFQQRGYLALAREGKFFIQTGLVWEVTRELIFSPVLSNSCCGANVPFLHSMRERKNRLWHSLPSDRAKCLIYCFVGVVLQFQRSISDNKWVCGNLEPEGHCLTKTSIVTSIEQCMCRREHVVAVNLTVQESREENSK